MSQISLRRIFALVVIIGILFTTCGDNGDVDIVIVNVQIVEPFPKLIKT